MEWTQPTPEPGGRVFAVEATTDSGLAVSLRLIFDDDQVWSLLVAQAGQPWGLCGWGVFGGEPSTALADIVVFAALADADVQREIETVVGSEVTSPYVQVEVESLPEPPPSRLIYAEDLRPGAVVALGEGSAWGIVLQVRERGGTVSALLDADGVQTAGVWAALQPVRIRVDQV